LQAGWRDRQRASRYRDSCGDHRRDRYLNNRTEQSHRPLKQRYYLMLGFGNFESASRFCTAFDEVHNYFRIDKTQASLSARREVFISRWRELIEDVSAA